MNAARYAVIALMLAGCYESHQRPPDAGVPLEGPRIHPVELVTPDGARQPDGFFDRLLGVACDFRRASDGELRCLPRDVDIVGFEDADCRRPVVVVGPEGFASCGHAPYAQRVACDGGAALYRGTGATRTVDSVYWEFGGRCRERIGGGRWIVQAATPVEPSELVAAEPAPIPPGTGVVRAVLVTDEGERYPVGALWDRDRAVRCSLITDGARDRVAACAAVEGEVLMVAGGARCEQRFASEWERCSPLQPGDRVVGVERDGCGRYRRSVYELGPHRSADEINAMRCGHLIESAGWEAEPVAPAEMATLEVHRRGSGRLHPLAYASPGGEPFAGPAVFWDDALERTCRAERVNGVLRCVPEPFTGFVNDRPFDASDADCRVPALHPLESLSCDPGGAFIEFELSSCPRDGVDAVYAVGELVDRWHSYQSGRCQAVEGTPGERRHLLREVDLVRLERVVL